jgi:hypothetical protein
MKNTLLISIIFFLFSCTQEDKPKPSKDFIPPDLMEEVLLDMHLIKSMRSSGYALKEYDSMLGDGYFLEKYCVDSMQLVNSKNYYAQSPKEYLLIYKQIEKRLLVLKDSVAELNNRFEKRSD